MNWLRINRFLSCRFQLGLVPEINCKCITLTLNKTRNHCTHRKYVSKVKSIWINSKTNIHYILSPGTPHIQVSQKFLVNWVYTLRHSGHQHPPMWASACTSLASLCLYNKFIVFKTGCMYEMYYQYFSCFLTAPNQLGTKFNSQANLSVNLTPWYFHEVKFILLSWNPWIPPYYIIILLTEC